MFGNSAILSAYTYEMTGRLSTDHCVLLTYYGWLMLLYTLSVSSQSYNHLSSPP
jgi:hypothetical protein